MKILLADDDPFIRAVLESFLLKAGHEAPLCADGQEAICAPKTAGPFDVVITDIIMPRKDVMAVMSYIREHNLQIPVLAVAGYCAQDTLEKPVSRNTLLQAIKNLGGSKGTRAVLSEGWTLGE